MPTGTPTGGVSASVLITAAVGLVSGAVFGLLLGQIISQPVLVAVIASFLAILVASAVRYFIVSAGAGASFPGGGPAAMPSVLFINSLIASVFGGLAAHGLLAAASPPHPPVLTGAVAGLFGGVLMALLMICYYTARGEGFRAQR
jgi:hypothetical protein